MEQVNQIDVVQRGISDRFKEVIENYLMQSIKKPFYLWQKIVLDFKNTPVPSLTQIQSFIKYRRLKIGDVNSLEGVESFIENKIFNDTLCEGLNDEDPFYFGVQTGDGSDENHFHLGFTSKSLLSCIEKGILYKK